MTIGAGRVGRRRFPRAGPPHRTRGGAMIGGLVAMTLDKSIPGQLGRAGAPSWSPAPTAESTHHPDDGRGAGHPGAVATNAEGANMDAGLVSALALSPDAASAALGSTRCTRTSPTRYPRGDRAAEPVARPVGPGR